MGDRNRERCLGDSVRSLPLIRPRSLASRFSQIGASEENSATLKLMLL